LTPSKTAVASANIDPGVAVELDFRLSGSPAFDPPMAVPPPADPSASFTENDLNVPVFISWIPVEELIYPFNC
jgi:hypothetical protein